MLILVLLPVSILVLSDSTTITVGLSSLFALGLVQVVERPRGEWESG